MTRRTKRFREKLDNREQRARVGKDLGSVFTSESVSILPMPKSALEALGGKEGFGYFLDFIEVIKTQVEPRVAVFVCRGQELYPGTGLPSVFIADDAASAYGRGQQLLMSAMMTSLNPQAGYGNIYEGKAALPYINSFFDIAIELVGDQLTEEQSKRATALISREGE